jgi:hypothetical protein
LHQGLLGGGQAGQALDVPTQEQVEQGEKAVEQAAGKKQFFVHAVFLLRCDGRSRLKLDQSQIRQ